MREAKNMVGVKCGRLVVVARAPRKGTQKGAFWECVCECGTHTVVKGAALRRGVTVSCGCFTRDRMVAMGHSSALNLTGQRCGKLVAIRSLGEGKNRKVFWLCQCDCGKTVEVKVQLFREEKVQSCGCLNRQPITGSASFTHGHAPRSKVTRTYQTWQGMLQRCTNPLNPKFQDYGGRGITVCERWQTFENFLADMGIRPNGLSIDRINNDGNYEPGNCKWATRKEQMNNTRSNRWITFKGQTWRFREWAEQLGISETSLYRRLERWAIEKALTAPRRGDVPPVPHPVVECPVCGKFVKGKRDGSPWFHRVGKNKTCLGWTSKRTLTR